MMNPQMMRAFARFVQNPGAFFQQRGMQMPPQSAMQSPDSMIQWMLNSGGISQQQYNQIAAQSKQLQQNPQFMQMLQGLLGRK